MAKQDAKHSIEKQILNNTNPHNIPGIMSGVRDVYADPAANVAHEITNQFINQNR